MKAFLVFAFVQAILFVVYAILYVRQTIRQLAGRLYKSSERQGSFQRGRQKRR